MGAERSVSSPPRNYCSTQRRPDSRDLPDRGGGPPCVLELDPRRPGNKAAACSTNATAALKGTQDPSPWTKQPGVLPLVDPDLHARTTVTSAPTRNATARTRVLELAAPPGDF